MKTSKRERHDELRLEYSITELAKGAARGKYSQHYQAGTNLLLLEPDVSKAFPDARSV